MFNPPEYIVSTVGYTQEQLDAAVEAAIEATKENESKVYHRLVESAVAHAIETTKEKAAKVCEELENPKDDLSAYSDGWIGGIFDCAAAIREMK